MRKLLAYLMQPPGKPLSGGITTAARDNAGRSEAV